MNLFFGVDFKGDSDIWVYEILKNAEISRVLRKLTIDLISLLGYKKSDTIKLATSKIVVKRMNKQVQDIWLEDNFRYIF